MTVRGDSWDARVARTSHNFAVGPKGRRVLAENFLILLGLMVLPYIHSLTLLRFLFLLTRILGL